MEIIKFFKDAKGLWYVNNTIMPSGTLTFRQVTDTEVCINTLSTIMVNQTNNPLFKGEITDIKKENGTPYASVAEFITACKDFFVAADFTTLIEAVQNSGGTTLKAFSQNMARPGAGGTTAYIAGDVIGQLATISNVSKATGTGVRIGRVRIQTNDTGLAGKKINVHIYKDVPTSVPADNAPFTIDWTNAPKRIGVIPIVMGTGNLATVGMNDYNDLTLNPTARDVHYILETVDGFTPSAANTEFQVTIDTELSNN